MKRRDFLKLAGATGLGLFTGWKVGRWLAGAESTAQPLEDKLATTQPTETFDPSSLDDALAKYELFHAPDAPQYKIMLKNGGYQWGEVCDLGAVKPGMVGPYNLLADVEMSADGKTLQVPTHRIFNDWDHMTPEQQTKGVAEISTMYRQRQIFDKTKVSFATEFPGYANDVLYIFGRGTELAQESYWRPIGFVRTDKNGRAQFFFSMDKSAVDVVELVAVNPTDKKYQRLQ